MALIKPFIVYKRFNSCLELQSNLYIPSVQRNLIQEHVDKMRTHIKESITKGKEPIFGSIDLCFFEGKHYLIDGQHRYTAIRQEYQESNTLIPIHSLIYYVNSEEELEEIFVTRNKGIPIPSFILSMKETKKELLKDMTTYLERTCPSIFKHDKFARPYININTFLEHFRMSKIFGLIETLDHFHQVFKMLNQECYTKINMMTDKQRKKYGITDRMLLAWSEHKIYLGMHKNFEFLDELDIEGYKELLKNKKE